MFMSNYLQYGRVRFYRFRRGFQQVFRWCPFVHYSEVEATTNYMMHTQREPETTRYSVTGSPELQLTRVSRNGLSVKSIFENNHLFMSFSQISPIFPCIFPYTWKYFKKGRNSVIIG